MSLTISKTEPTEMFVYGTLRPGASEWARHGYTAAPVDGTAKGMLYNYGMAFPYADFDAEGTIVGNIVTLDPDMATEVARVEIGAGYEAREVLVTTKEGTRVVLGWQITASTKERMLKFGRIEDMRTDGVSDWNNFVEVEGAKYRRPRVRA